MVPMARRALIEQDLFRLLDEQADERRLSAPERRVLELSIRERVTAIRLIDTGTGLDLIVPIGRPVRR